jgi:hypothetical protein
MTAFLSYSNKEKDKVRRQKALKKKGPFTNFEEDLIKDLFTKSVSFAFISCCFSVPMS